MPIKADMFNTTKIQLWKSGRNAKAETVAAIGDDRDSVRDGQYHGKTGRHGAMRWPRGLRQWAMAERGAAMGAGREGCGNGRWPRGLRQWALAERGALLGDGREGCETANTTARRAGMAQCDGREGCGNGRWPRGVRQWADWR